MKEKLMKHRFKSISIKVMVVFDVHIRFITV